MLLGEYHHSIDEKNRLVIPSKYRDILINNSIITRGIEKCLYIYPNEEWERIVSKLNTLPFTKKDARSFMRFFYSGATALEFDKSGRINIPSTLISYANIKKECIIIGVNDHLEIWSEELYDKFLSENIDNLENISENLFGGENNAL